MIDKQLFKQRQTRTNKSSKLPVILMSGKEWLTEGASSSHCVPQSNDRHQCSSQEQGMRKKESVWGKGKLSHWSHEASNGSASKLQCKLTAWLLVHRAGGDTVCSVGERLSYSLPPNSTLQSSSTWCLCRVHFYNMCGKHFPVRRK